jgi:hypothetical protein
MFTTKVSAVQDRLKNPQYYTPEKLYTLSEYYLKYQKRIRRDFQECQEYNENKIRNIKNTNQMFA